MHPGNLFVDPQGRLCAVDFGIMGRLGPKERRFLAEILLGFITRDYRRVAEVHFEAGYVPAHHAVEDFAQAIRAIGEPIHDRTADQISMAKLLTLLFEITALFDMATRTELVMLQKTMVVVEGVGRKPRPAARHVEHRPSPWCASGSSAISGPSGRIEEAGRGAASRWRRCSAGLPGARGPRRSGWSMALEDATRRAASRSRRRALAGHRPRRGAAGALGQLWRSG